MSAWDIAGAFVWTLASIGAALMARLHWKRSPTDWMDAPRYIATLHGLAGIAAGFAAVYCIARLAGAHA